MTWISDALAKWGIEPAPQCPLCRFLEGQLGHAQAEVLELRLALADGEPTRSARHDLEVVNRRLAVANDQIAVLQQQVARHKGKS
jgi:hypothetical protein